MKKIVLVLGFLSIFSGGVHSAGVQQEVLGQEPAPVMERVKSSRFPFFKTRETRASQAARKLWAQKKALHDAAAVEPINSGQPEDAGEVVSLKDFINNSAPDLAANLQEEQPAGTFLPATQRRRESQEEPAAKQLLSVSSSETVDPVESPKRQTGRRILTSVKFEPQSEDGSFSGQNPYYLEHWFNNPSSRNITLRDGASGGAVAACALAIYLSHDFRDFNKKARRSGEAAVTFKAYCVKRLNQMKKTEWARLVVALAAAGLVGTALHHIFVSGAAATQN